MEQIIKEHLPQIKALFKKYGAKSAYVFGSSVSKKTHAKSDADFLFSFPEEMNYEDYADNYFALAHALEDLLKRPVDLVAEKTLTNPYLIESINEKKVRVL